MVRWCLAILGLMLMSWVSFVSTMGAGTEDILLAIVFPPWWTAESSFAAVAQKSVIASTGAASFVILVPGKSRQTILQVNYFASAFRRRSDASQPGELHEI